MLTNTIQRRIGRRGQVLLLLVLLLSTLIGLSALAFDLAYAYAVKTLLATSVDAAALAGIRALPAGNDAVAAAVTRTFEGNFPDGTLMAISRSITTPTIEAIPGGRRVSITGDAQVPMFFARWFGRSELTIEARADTLRRDRNIMLILDYSGSVAAELPDIKIASKAFVDTFDPTIDQVGLASFSTMAGIEYAPQANFTSGIKTAIDNLQTENYTNSATGLYWGYRGLKDLGDPLAGSKLNAIVFFSDGVANWFPGNFSVKTTAGGCASSPVMGVRGIGGGGNSKFYRVLSLSAPGSPVASWPHAAGCESSTDADDLVTSIDPVWYPSGGYLPGGVSIHGIQGSASPTDMSEPNLEKIAANMQVNISDAIRDDSTLNVMVNAIGYGGVDQNIMRAVANTDDSATYNPTTPKGLYVYASSTAELIDAFQQVASSLGRLVR